MLTSLISQIPRLQIIKFNEPVFRRTFEQVFQYLDMSLTEQDQDPIIRRGGYLLDMPEYS